MNQMFEKLILPEDYTEDIKNAIRNIKHKMNCVLTEHSDDDIKVFRHSNLIYVVANPQLGREPVFDELGNIKEVVPLYNITTIWDKLLQKPRIKIMIPELCTRIIYES